MSAAIGGSSARSRWWASMMSTVHGGRSSTSSRTRVLSARSRWTVERVSTPTASPARTNSATVSAGLTAYTWWALTGRSSSRSRNGRAPGRKYLRGPRGTGFLYARAATTADLHPPFIDVWAATWTTVGSYELRPDARRFENWESYVAGRLGLGAAADYAMAVGVDHIQTRVCQLAGRLRTALADIAGVAVHDKGRRPGGIVTFSHDALDADRIGKQLRARHINTWVCRAPSTRLDHELRNLPDVVRASVHYFNTDNELDQLTQALREMIGTGR